MSATAPETRKAEATRLAIVETAERLFRTIGYQKTTVADIARELRMSPANVYRFFASKAAINEAIAERLLGGMTDMAWSIARGPGRPAERLVALFVALEDQTKALFFKEKRMHDMVAAAMEEHWGVCDAYVHNVNTALRHVLMDGIAAGDFTALDPEHTSRLVHATMLAFTHPTVIAQDCGQAFPGMAAAMADFVVRALRPDK
jgi:AcrR family transcriptional regulator